MTEQDTREKLEEDVRSHFWHNDWCRTEMVIGWLDRQAAITEHELMANECDNCEPMLAAVREIHELKTERTCHNKARYGNFKCDVCNALLQLTDLDDEPILTVDGVGYVPDFCPHCGAKVVDA